MLRAQGLSQQQQVDFVLAALEGEVKRELQLNNPRDKNTGTKVLDILDKLYTQLTTKEQPRASFFNCRQLLQTTANNGLMKVSIFLC